MVRENCEHCGRFLGTYHKELIKDTINIKKGSIVEVYGCKNCDQFTLEGVVKTKEQI